MIKGQQTWEAANRLSHPMMEDLQGEAMTEIYRAEASEGAEKRDILKIQF